MKRILIVDDDQATSAGLSDIVEAWGYEAESAYTIESGWAAIERLVPDCALVDLRLPDGSGIDLLKRIRESYPDISVVILTGHATVDTAVSALKVGAADYISKPVNLARLEVTLKSLEERQQMRREILDLRRQLQKMGAMGQLVGRSPAIRRLFDEIEMVAKTEANVFIVGQSGTGKEVVANTIHTLSRRSNRPFIAFNCGAISPSLIESEIFGHEKGAFTNAIKRREGYFEMARGGTIFLDEITEMPLDLQVKLLRVLEESRFRRVGGNEELSMDARIIAASNREPVKAITENRLREDLYYRLNVFPIELPPLRDRKEDIPLFAYHFLDRLNETEDKRVDKIEPDFLQALMAYEWPGNVRELRNAISRAFIMARGDVLTVECLPEKQFAEARSKGASMSIPFGTRLSEIEKLVTEQTLQLFGGDRVRASEMLGFELPALEPEPKVPFRKSPAPAKPAPPKARIRTPVKRGSKTKARR